MKDKDVKKDKVNQNNVLNYLKERLEKFWQNYNVMFIVTIIIGIIAHGFMIANKLPNHDDLQSLYSKGLTFEMGRWGLEIIKYIFPNYSMPWLNGIIFLLLISVSAILIAKILGIKSKIKQCLIGAIMITYSSITSTMAYMFTTSSYGVAILLAVLAVYYAIKMGKKSHLILSVICIILSLSIYQAYICITATLFLILLIKDCLGKDTLKNILLRALKFLTILIISSLIYLASVIFINYITGYSLEDYQGADSLSSISILEILNGIKKCYLVMPRLILRDYYGVSAGILLKLGYGISFITIFILALVILKRLIKESKTRAVLFIILGILMPLTMNLLYIVNDKTEMHSLMVYANFFVLILPLVLINELSINLDKSKIINYLNNIITVVLAIMVFKYVTFANESYLELKLSYENTYSFYSILANRIESAEGFDENTKVAFVGTYTGGLLAGNYIAFSDLDDFTGILNNYELINAYSKENFIRNYIGIDFNYATSEEIQNLINNKEVQEMSNYPYDNSIKKIDNIIVVKFSEESLYIVN